jgi:DNA invertase Pin-like site-specific DNA recombinase
MSRELQRYSIANQMAAIAAYAETNALTVVHTYRDEGRSGLRIKERHGLIELIEDVQSGRADFDRILVYDVSRGAGSRMSTRVPTTNACASGTASRSNTARRSSRTTAPLFPASRKA